MPFSKVHPPPPPFRNLVGRRVRRARETGAECLTQDQLAGRLAGIGVPIDRVMIAKIETGRRCVYDFEVLALSKALKVDVAWLLGAGEPEYGSGGGEGLK